MREGLLGEKRDANGADHFLEREEGKEVGGQVMMNVLAMSSCQLLAASLLKMPEIYVSKKVEARFIFQCREFALRWAPFPLPLLACSSIPLRMCRSRSFGYPWGGCLYG